MGPGFVIDGQAPSDMMIVIVCVFVGAHMAINTVIC